MADFAELKSQITGLVTSLEEIEREAATLQDTNKVLQEIAQTMNGVCGSMAKVINESEMVYDYVNETSAKQTLDSFHKAAAQFKNVSSNMVLTYANETAALKAHVDESIAQLNAEMQKKIIMNETSAKQTLDSFHEAAAQFNNVSSNMVLTYANETAALKAHVDESIAQLNAEMQKKIIMLGGAAIACAVIAIVMAII